MSRKVMITGGLGFIGSNLTRLWLERFPEDEVLVLDAVTYAARPEYLEEYLDASGARSRCSLLIQNITDAEAIRASMLIHRPDLVLHLAAESHVCRSIEGPKDFFHTNVVGTFNLLQSFHEAHKGDPTKRFIHVSTDEVFGELESLDPPFSEKTQIAPRSPYAASKAASDHVALSYFHTYGVPVVVTNCSNNFGPNQHEEKLIPATITRILKHEPARVYGSGLHVRDWLSVHDHCEALILLAHAGEPGERYCIGGENEKTNLQIINAVHAAVIQATGETHDLTLEFTDDRPTDDKRYAINCEKLKVLGWKPTTDFWGALLDTVRFYLRESARGGAERAQGKGGTDA